MNFSIRCLRQQPKRLKPVSMISEDNGIKIEVISAYVESGEAKILISVQDLEEDRIDETYRFV